jgi:hypothetical protein
MTTISKPNQVFDIRLVARHINAGLTTKKDHDQFMKQLPDAADNFEHIPKELMFDMPEQDADDDDSLDD